MHSNTIINICIAKRCFYIASLKIDMFRPLYRPSSGCTFSYFKQFNSVQLLVIVLYGRMLRRIIRRIRFLRQWIELFLIIGLLLLFMFVIL